MGLRTFFRKKRRQLLVKLLPELGGIIEDGSTCLKECKASRISGKSKVYPPYHLYDSKIGDYTYITKNSRISMADIGKFCSIGPNFVCGYGIHPTDTVSTSPMFYSTMKQNGKTLSKSDKVVERKRIRIGNDVFIGINVTVLDGVTIGDSAVIGAGAVVSKDIPPYAIAVGCPIRIIRYRFPEETIQRLLRLKWWDRGEDCLRLVEKNIFDIDAFLAQAESTQFPPENNG